MTNRLYYGDNLEWLARAEAFVEGSVDLVYLDPPFNSNANYNVLFREPGGGAAESQIEAFQDTWHWNESAEAAFARVLREGGTGVAELLRAMLGFLGRNDLTAYLAMMAVRMVALRRVMAETASLYLHCDPTASHYLKLLLDAAFGPDNFRAEFIWKRSSAHSDGKQGRRLPGCIHDVILFYTKSDRWTWNTVYTPYDAVYVENFYRYEDEAGRRYRLDNLSGPGGKDKGNPSYEVMGVTRYWRYTREKMAALVAEGRVIQTRPGAVPAYKRYLDEMQGVPLQDLWTDIGPIAAQAAERLGYPTQKPLALLERIIQVSSNPGDLVLDPFCGCGTAVHAAEKLGRRWAGIDITYLAINLIERRLRDAFPGIAFSVEGAPRDLPSAQDLARRDKYQFQWWAVAQVGARPWQGKKKGADGGIDGIIYFTGFDAGGKPRSERAIVSVKGGTQRSLSMVAELVETIQRQNAPIGILLLAALPTREMEARAAAAGFVEGYEGVPRIQMLTLAELFEGKRPRIPNIDAATFRRAEEETGRGQGGLAL